MEAQPPYDVMLGGGIEYYDSRRKDGRNLLQEHSQAYAIVTDAASLEREVSRSKAAQRPLLGLFSNGSMMYDIDRRGVPESTRQPSLAQVSRLCGCMCKSSYTLHKQAALQKKTRTNHF
jgi:alkaline phosphatase